MEENSECKSCKTLEEELYWKHFSSMQFYLILPPDFYDHLLLPEKFAAHMTAQLPNKVSLKSPSGASWNIDLLKTDDLLFVGDQWKAFVKANDLKENCLLLFKFKRNSDFEVSIFDQESFCEKESAYFVKKCAHAESSHVGTKKRTVREKASSTKVVEEGDDDVVVSKKSRKDDGAVVGSAEKEKTQTPQKQVLVAASGSERPRRIVSPHKSPDKFKTQSREKSISNELAKEASQSSQRDVITPEAVNDHPHELQSQSKKSRNGNATAKEPTQTENGKVSSAKDHSPKENGQSGNQPNRNGAEKQLRQSSERDFIDTENGESCQAKDLSHRLEARSEKRPRIDGASKEPKLTTPGKGVSVLVSDCSQAEIVRKESNGRSFAKMIRPDYRESSSEDDHSSKTQGTRGRGRGGRGRGRPKLAKMIIPDYRESSSEDDQSSKTQGTRGRGRGGRGRGRPKPPTSSKKLVFNSDKRKSSEYMSNRRPVTEVEKDDALQRAIQQQTENSFIAIMRPTTVYKRFFLSVPKDWVHKHVASRSQEFALRVGDKTWHVTLFHYGSKSAGFSTGWKKFALDNFLEEFDVLLFKLVSWNDNAAVVMDVDIFRVVDNSMPPIP